MARRAQGGSNERHGQGGGDKWWVLGAVVFGAFASILDSTIVNTALPRIQQQFHASLHLASYVTTAYILAAGAVVPATAFLAHRFGIKRIYLASLVLFTVGSVLCGFAPNILLLIAFRVLQGAGGAGLFPLSFAILFDAFPQEERGKANGVFGLPVLVAPALGPTLGGFLTQYVDWRVVFFVNVPVGIVGVLLGAKVLHPATPDRGARFDAWGFGLAAAGVALLLYGLSNLAFDGLGAVESVSGPIVAGLALLIAFVIVELRREQPLLDLRLYTRRNFAIGNVITLVVLTGLFGPGFLLPQYLQNLRGLSPFGSGLLLLWQGIGSIGGTLTSGQLYGKLGPKPLIIAGGAGAAAATFALSRWVTPTAALDVLPWILVVRGFCLPILLQPTGTASLDGIRGPQLPVATTIRVATRNVMASFVIAVLTDVLNHRTRAYVAQLGLRVAPGSLSGHIAGRVPLPVLAARAHAFADVFLIAAAVIVPAFLLAVFLRSSVGRKRGEKAREQAGEERAA